MLFTAVVLAICCTVVLGFSRARMGITRGASQSHSLSPVSQQALRRNTLHAESPESQKGFGKAKEVQEKDMPELSAGDKTYASQAKRGVPEYSIFIRPKGENGEEAGDEEWVPVGSMTIPRDVPVGKAIYDVEGELLKGTFKLYPKLKAFYDVRSEESKKNMWEYGSTLKAFPDEPIIVRTREDAAEGGNGDSGGGNWFSNYVKSVTSPMDTGGLTTPGAVTMNQNGPSKAKGGKGKK